MLHPCSMSPVQVTAIKQLDDAEEHRGNSPFEAASSAQLVEEDVGGHPAAQDATGVDAGVPESV